MADLPATNPPSTPLPSKPPPPATPLPTRKTPLELSTLARETKRRRISEATATLSKPFRSPLLATPKSTPLPTPCSPTPPSTATKQSTFSPSSTPSKVLSYPTPTPTSTSTSSRKIAFPRSKPRRSLGSSGSSLFSSSISSDPEIAALYKERSSLESQIRAEKALLETAAQALKIENLSEDDSDEKLEELIEKWRAASRTAADYLYGIVGDRVNRMGGPGAWKDVIQRGRRGWDDEEEKKGGDEDEERCEDERQEEEEKEEASEVFTMEAMLKALNIDLDLIGYDRERECWT
ncbi:hypothetical protein RUND412_007446 [Rhizina undulata]